MNRYLRPLFLSCVLLCGASHAAPNAPAPNAATAAAMADETALEIAFQAGNAAMEKRDYATALKQYRIVLAAQPDEPSSLWNGGSAAFFTGDFKAAQTYFERLQKQEPKDGALLAKRVQTAQELGDFKARDTLRAQIFALRKSGADESGYTKGPRYCRDQFFVGADENKLQVLAFEYWELKPLEGDKDKPYLGRVYEFYAMAPDEDKPKIRIETGWSSLDVNADGTFAPSREMPAFYYDAYYATGPWLRRTFGLLPQKPTYEAAKAQIIAIIEGRAEAGSGQKRDEKGATIFLP